MNHPILYYKASTGKLHQWRVWSEGDSIFTEHGQVGGKLQTTPGKKCQPTNVGKANERNAVDQAAFEVRSMWTNKIERKYSSTPSEAAEQLFLPMLAHPIEKVKAKDLVFPAHTQPKLDGVRCLAYWEDDEVLLMSRSGKSYSVPHIQETLKGLLPKDAIFDGEIYCHGQSCQTVTSWVKNADKGDREQLVYHVYDLPMVLGQDDLPWSARCLALDQLLGPDRIDPGVNSEGVRMLGADVVSSRETVDMNQRRYIEQGYEGAMLRLAGGKYEWGHRSRNLLKVKTFQDENFLVVGAREGEGKMLGAVVWRCKNDVNDLEFDVSMACSMEHRQAYFRGWTNYVGRKLTVKFFDRTDDQLPRFPVGKLFRDNKDLG